MNFLFYYSKAFSGEEMCLFAILKTSKNLVFSILVKPIANFYRIELFCFFICCLELPLLSNLCRVLLLLVFPFPFLQFKIICPSVTVV